MRVLMFLFITFSLTLIGCKQEVGFTPSPNTELPVVAPPPTGTAVKAPVVKVLKAPQDQMLGEENEVVFEVIKGDNEISNVECSVDNIKLPCDWFKGIFKIIGVPLGEHLFKVVATDTKGLKGEADESWKVYHGFKRNKENISVTGNKNQSDILFVIDNSPSMKAEQRKISRRFDKFINQIKGLDWNIGITTTDGRRNLAWSDGKLDPFSNGDYFLTPAIGEDKAQSLFAEHVKRSEKGSDTEVGIYATYRAIERSLDPQKEVDDQLDQFLRPKAALAVVVVSDEDESRDKVKNKGESLVKLVEKKWGENKVFQFNSIIVHTRKCLDGHGAAYGRKYEKLSRETNGVVGDVCADNYSKILKDIGQGVADLQKVHNLKCEPQDIDKDGQVDLVILPSGVHKVPGYTIDKRRVEFDQPLNAGDYTFHYFCLK